MAFFLGVNVLNYPTLVVLPWRIFPKENVLEMVVFFGKMVVLP
jgi:hypothetical protein